MNNRYKTKKQRSIHTFAELAEKTHIMDDSAFRAFLMRPLSYESMNYLVKVHILNINVEIDQLDDFIVKLIYTADEWDDILEYRTNVLSLLLAENSMTNKDLEQDLFQQLIILFKNKLRDVDQPEIKGLENIGSIRHSHDDVMNFIYTVYKYSISKKYDAEVVVVSNIVKPIFHSVTHIIDPVYLCVDCVVAALEFWKENQNLVKLAVSRNKSDLQVKSLNKTVESMMKKLEREESINEKLKNKLRSLELTLKESDREIEKRAYEAKINTLTYEKEELIQELQALKKDMEIKTKELLLSSSYKEYSEDLEKVIENFDNEDVELSDTLASLVENRRVLVFSEIEDWKRKFSSKLKDLGINYKIVDIDFSTDLPCITEKDITIINIFRMSHSQYYRLMNHVRRYDTPVCRIFGKGINSSLNAICDSLKVKINQA